MSKRLLYRWAHVTRLDGKMIMVHGFDCEPSKPPRCPRLDEGNRCEIAESTEYLKVGEIWCTERD